MKRCYECIKRAVKHCGLSEISTLLQFRLHCQLRSVETTCSITSCRRGELLITSGLYRNHNAFPFRPHHNNNVSNGLASSGAGRVTGAIGAMNLNPSRTAPPVPPQARTGPSPTPVNQPPIPRLPSRPAPNPGNLPNPLPQPLVPQ